MIGSRRLVEVLSEWGHREVAQGKPGAHLPSPGESLGPLVDGIEAILRHVPQLIARILLAEPIEVVRVRIEAEEGGNLLPCNAGGRTLAVIAERLRLDGSSCSGRRVQALVATGTPVDGPFVCAMQIADGDGSVIIYDGMHRMAAWHIHACRGLRYPVDVDLIQTKGRDPWGPPVIGAQA